MRPRLLIEVAILDTRDTELACDLADDHEGVDRCKQQLNDLLEEWQKAIPRQRCP